ncbi:MAG: hypothetical protein JXR59_11395 [Desulfuromonadaceae bacterium]|nr:hypothetical protein [Desulfuromonadaceae bacterium]
MSKMLKLLLALLTFWPLIYLLSFFALAVAMVYGLGGPLADFMHSEGGFQVLFAVHLSTMVEILCLLAFYCVFLYRTDRVPTQKKTLWTVILFMGNLFAMPVFWYLYLWRPQADSESSINKQGNPPAMPGDSQSLTVPGKN